MQQMQVAVLSNLACEYLAILGGEMRDGVTSGQDSQIDFGECWPRPDLCRVLLLALFPWRVIQLTSLSAVAWVAAVDGCCDWEIVLCVGRRHFFVAAGSDELCMVVG